MSSTTERKALRLCATQQRLRSRRPCSVSRQSGVSLRHSSVVRSEDTDRSPDRVGFTQVGHSGREGMWWPSLECGSLSAPFVGLSRSQSAETVIPSGSSRGFSSARSALSLRYSRLGGSRRRQGCGRSHVHDARHNKTSQLRTRRTNAGSASWCHLHPDQSDSTLDGTIVSL